jgi:prefoldin subunit 5
MEFKMNFLGRSNGQSFIDKNISQTENLFALAEDTSDSDSERKLKEAGESDGRNRIPDVHAYSPSQVELGIIARGDKRIQKVNELAQRARSQVNQELQPIVSRLSSINKRWREINKKLEERKASLGRDFLVGVSHKMHLFIIVFLGLGEFPLNAIVFQMFGEPELMTYIMSSTLALTIPLLALFSGIVIRHNMRRIFGNLIVGLLMPVSIGGVLVAVTYVREMYLITGGHVAHGVANNSTALGYSIFALNLLVFSAALVISYFAHDPDEQLDHLRKDIIAIEKLRKPLLSQYSKLSSRMNAIRQVAEARIHAEEARTVSLVHMYRESNMTARGGTLVPLIFNKKPEIAKVELWEKMPENPDEI